MCLHEEKHRGNRARHVDIFPLNIVNNVSGLAGGTVNTSESVPMVVNLQQTENLSALLTAKQNVKCTSTKLYGVESFVFPRLC